MLWLEVVIMIHPVHNTLVIIPDVKTGIKFAISFSKALSTQMIATKNAMMQVGVLHLQLETSVSCMVMDAA
jgi:hypothetical protein